MRALVYTAIMCLDKGNSLNSGIMTLRTNVFCILPFHYRCCNSVTRDVNSIIGTKMPHWEWLHNPEFNVSSYHGYCSECYYQGVKYSALTNALPLRLCLLTGTKYYLAVLQFYAFKGTNLLVQILIINEFAKN